MHHFNLSSIFKTSKLMLIGRKSFYVDYCNINQLFLILQETINDSDKPQSQKFSFEYLFNKDKLQWITVESDQVMKCKFSTL